MGRPPSIPAEKKTRIVLSVIAGELTIAEAARREKVSEQSIGRWKADFLEAGKTALAAGKSGPSTREEQLEAEVADLSQALGEAAVEIRVWNMTMSSSCRTWAMVKRRASSLSASVTPWRCADSTMTGSSISSGAFIRLLVAHGSLSFMRTRLLVARFLA